MYFVVSLHVDLDEFIDSSHLTTIASAVAFLKAHKDSALGYQFRFYEDDGLPLRCHWIEFCPVRQIKNVSDYSRFRSYVAFRRSLSNYIKIAKYYELPF